MTTSIDTSHSVASTTTPTTTTAPTSTLSGTVTDASPTSPSTQPVTHTLTSPLTSAPPLASLVSTSSTTTSSSSSTNKRKADLSYSSKVKDSWEKTAATHARDGVGDAFNKGYDRLKLGHTKSKSSYAYTQDGSSKRQMVIKFNPTSHPGTTEDERIGRLAETLTHEMHVHARRDLDAHFHKAADSSADSDHERMHDPAHRDEFLSASRSTFNHLDNPAQRQAFAGEWQKDMNSEVSDAGLDSTSLAARKEWIKERRNSFDDAVAHPETHSWTGVKPATTKD